MNTKIVKIDPAHPRMEDIREAGRIIREGGLVAFPTETVYGLGGNALDVTASQRIYAAKGRPSDNPLIVHIADMASLLPLVTEIPEAARKLASACWPGPLTMIFHKSSIVPLETTGGLDSVAVRFPSHPIACALIREGGGYVAAPSANTSGRPSPTMAEHVIEDLKGKIEMIVDGGSEGNGLESTIVDFTENIPPIFRPGYINEQMLRDILGEVRMDKGLLAENSRIHPKAPGMKYRHYAPKGSLLIVEGQTDRVAAKIEEMAREKTAAGYTVGIIGTDESVGRYSSGIIKSIGTRSDEESIGRHLYSVLREFDDCGAAYIFSESFDTPKMGQAIMNRLLKAAGHQVIKV